MYLTLLCFACALVASTATVAKPQYDIENAEQLFADFAAAHDKTYTGREKQRRLNIFVENLKTINRQNAKGGARFAVNQFTDLTREEFTSMYTGFKPNPLGENPCQIVTDDDVKTKDAPASKSWVDEGAVTPIKNQKACGSCWAFATIGSIEGQTAIVNKKLLSLSEQELVDCSKSNLGCKGGDMVQALTDLINLGGVESETSYGYTATAGPCRFDASKVEVKLTGCTNYRLKDEAKFKEVLAKKGPIIIGINASGIGAYAGGILDRAACDDSVLDHAVLLVGYGTDEKGVDYWLVKNSWGMQWGEKGYFRLTRGENTCGLMSGEMNAAANL